MSIKCVEQPRKLKLQTKRFVSCYSSFNVFTVLINFIGSENGLLKNTVHELDPSNSY